MVNGVLDSSNVREIIVAYEAKLVSIFGLFGVIVASVKVLVSSQP